MQIFDYLRSEHDTVKDILSRMMETKENQGDARRDLIDQLKEHLLPHQQAEEAYFYQILFDETDRDSHVHEDVEEHRASRFVLSDLENTPYDAPAWHGICQVLQELVGHHIESEEDETFELARTVIDSSRAETVGQRFEEIENEQKMKLFS